MALPAFPIPGMAKMMGIKAVTDPDIKKLSVDEMIAGNCQRWQGPR
jgi:hypothetical protein